MDDMQLAYLAGFIDGEGHIAIGLNRSNSNGRRRWYLRFACHQVNPEPLKLLQQRFDGSIQHTARTGTQRGIFEWVTVAAAAAKALRELRPLLIVRAAEADVAIEFQTVLEQRLRTHNPKRALTLEEEAQREELYRKMRDLKRLLYDET